MGQAARAGSLEKDRPGQDYDATLLPNRQHAEPLNMQPLFFFSLDGLRGAALGPRAGWAGSRGLELTCVSSAESILPPNLQEQLQIQHQFDLASQFPASVAGRSRQRPWVSCVCSASRFDAIEARGWRIFLDFSLQTGCRLLRYNSCRSTGKHACSLPEWYHYRQTGWRLFLDFHLLLFGLGRTYKLRVENKDID